MDQERAVQRNLQAHRQGVPHCGNPFRRGSAGSRVKGKHHDQGSPLTAERPPAVSAMRYLSVCSGIEAASVAWKLLGWQCAGFAEIAPFPSAVLAHHFPEVTNYGDFTTIEAKTIGPIDLLVGGTPCQAFSVAGLRGGLADERGNLALEFLRLADRLRPRWVLFENVPGVLSSLSHAAPDPCPPPPPLDMGCDGQEVDTEDEYDSEELHAFNCFLAGLSDIGYGFSYRIFDAQFFGLAQRRERVFVVGYLGDWRPACTVLVERESLSWNPAPRREQGERAAPTISARPTAGGGLGTDFDLDGGLIAGTLGQRTCDHTSGMKSESDFLVASTFTGNPYGDHTSRENHLIAHVLRREGHDASEDGTGRGTPIVPVAFALRGREGGAMPKMEGDCVGALRAANGGSSRSYLAFGGNRTSGALEVAAALNAKGGTGRCDFESETLLAFDCKVGANTGFAIGDVAGALRGEGGGGGHAAIAGGAGVRRITPKEAERLQGFPDGFTKIPWRGRAAEDCPDGPRYKAIGNSMAVPVMAWIGQRIAAAEKLLDGEYR